MMAILFLAKFVASSISLGCGAPGGVFGPVFFIGAMGGGAARALVSFLIPRVTGVRGSYALVGLGAFLAATTHAPLTAIFLLTEMTGSYDVTLPALICSILALVVARSIEPESIDTYALARRGISLDIDKDRLALSRIANRRGDEFAAGEAASRSRSRGDFQSGGRIRPGDPAGS